MRLLIYLCVITSMVLVFGCGPSKRVGKPKTKLLNYKTPELLVEELSKHYISTTWLSTKSQIQYKSASTKQSVTAQIRIKQDSAIWISVTPFLGIEVARVLITPDSVKYLDRFNKQYSIKSIASLKQYIPIEGDYYTVQNILYGNLFSYNSNTTFKTVYNNNSNYIISSLTKKGIKGYLKSDQIPAQSQHHAWIAPDNYRITKHLIADFDSNHNIQIEYSDFKSGDYGTLPKETNLSVSSDEKITVSIKHLRIFNNKHTELPFSIPASYERIN